MGLACPLRIPGAQESVTSGQASGLGQSQEGWSQVFLPQEARLRLLSQKDLAPSFPALSL